MTGVEDEQDLLQRGMEQLRATLGEGWEVSPLKMAVALGANDVPGVDQQIDAVWMIRNAASSSGYGEMIVEAKAELSPAAATRTLGPQVALMRQLRGQAAVLIISPWLSPRTREVLEERGFGYLDLTGNVSLRLNQPTVFIKTQGDQHNPSPRASNGRGLSGPRAGRLVRELADHEPPRRARELAAATEMSEGYVSRLLEIFTNEALIRRDSRVITDVDWAGLLRTRAATYRLMKANHVSPALARQGRNRMLDALRRHKSRHPVLMTGSFAAQTFTPTTVGGALMLYVPPEADAVEEVARDLGLMRIDQGADADVLLLRPMSAGPLLDRHPEPIDGIDCVGLSQLVLDCLSGPGRMPAEGEALIAWMTENPDAWRRPSPLGSEGDGLF